jgi:hypothetical protein
MLTGQFSGHLQHCCFLFVDEAFWAGDAKAEGRPKSLVTEKTITIRPLYVGAFQVRNMLHIMMASNNDWVVPAGHGARRYAVFKVGDAVVDDLEYFNRLNAEIDGVAQKRCCMISFDLISMGGTQNAFIKPKRQWNRRATHFGGLMPRLRQCFRRAHYQSPAPKYPNRCLSGGNRPMALEDFPRILRPPSPSEARPFDTILLSETVPPLHSKLVIAGHCQPYSSRAPSVSCSWWGVWAGRDRKEPGDDSGSKTDGREAFGCRAEAKPARACRLGDCGGSMAQPSTGRAEQERGHSTLGLGGARSRGEGCEAQGQAEGLTPACAERLAALAQDQPADGRV